MGRVFVKAAVVAADRAGQRSMDRPVQSIVKMARELGLTVTFVDNDTLSSLVGDRPHQGVVLTCSRLPLSTATADLDLSVPTSNDGSAFPIALALDRVQDPMNLGAIARSAQFFGVSCIYLCPLSAPLSPVASKASAGSLEQLAFRRVPDLRSWLLEADARGWATLATCAPDEQTADGSSPTPASVFRVARPTILVRRRHFQPLMLLPSRIFTRETSPRHAWD